ncbi:MAG: winged helix-turn-helix transcriptional regulator [Oscillospiraceae bacterium]|nr:winged helix-turn-helix transcriptional regulator [Oscillospiraceae bacterium]
MDMSWMGRYRTLVMALVQHSNISARGGGIRDRITDDVWLNAHEWQVLEYIIEHAEDDAYMNRISEVLGLPQSSFSRSVSLLSSYGLVERYQTESNRKNVLLRPTEKGILVYKEKYSQLDNELFEVLFKSLDRFDDETIKGFSEALLAFNKVLKEDSDKRNERAKAREKK